MKILAIDTSCDETAAAVTENTKILSNVVWSQASLHAKFGGVMPSLAQRMHEERIDFVIKKALGTRDLALDIDAVAVTIGPGLSIALAVGVNKAKELAKKYNKPLIAVNHVEAHLLSSFANLKPINFPAFGLVLSGGTTLFCLIEGVGKYKVQAETTDDALGEALDKAARILGLGYPGASVLEKLAKTGDAKKYSLPIPLIEDKIKNRFSYSGLKSAFVRLFSSIKNPTRQDVSNLASSFQNVAFKHVENVITYQIVNCKLKIENLLVGGGVMANVELRKRLRKLCKKHGITLHLPYTKKLMSDNAGMVGVAAFLNPKYVDIDSIDREPRLKI